MLKVKYTYKYPISAPVDRVGMSITRDQIEPDTIAKLQTLSEQIAVKRYADLTEKKWVVEADPVEFYSASELLKDIPRDGLVGEWLFFEGAGATLYDLSGNNNHGTIYGMTWQQLATGKIVGSFDGVDDYVEVADNPILNFGTNSFSIIGWIKTSIVSPAAMHWINKHGLGTGVGYNFQVWFGKARAKIADGTSYGICDSRILVADDKWHHVGMVVDRDNQAMYVYVDGRQDNSIDISFIGSVTNTYNLRLGMDVLGGSSFNGLIGLVRIYNRALTEEEVREIYELEAPIFGITP